MDDLMFRSKGALVALAALGLVVILTAVFVVDPEPAAPPGSTLNDSEAGVSIYYELLGVLGYDVERRRVPVADSAPDPASTLVLIGSSVLEPRESDAIARFVDGGGRVVSVGPVSGSVVDGVRAGASTQAAVVLFPHPDLRGVGGVANPGGRAWGDAGDALPLLGRPGAVVVSTARVGSGSVWAVSDASVVANGAIALSDNALLAVAIVGPPGRSVEFAEYIHGFGRSTGLGAVPVNWRWGLGFAGFAGLVWLLAHARRLGPPEDDERSLPPPRVRYVESLAAVLARTGDTAAATSPVRKGIRSRLADLGLTGPDESDLSGAAAYLGVDEAKLAEALEPPAHEEAVLASGRVLARLHGGFDDEEVGI